MTTIAPNAITAPTISLFHPTTPAPDAGVIGDVAAADPAAPAADDPALPALPDADADAAVAAATPDAVPFLPTTELSTTVATDPVFVAWTCPSEICVTAGLVVVVVELALAGLVAWIWPSEICVTAGLVVAWIWPSEICEMAALLLVVVVAGLVVAWIWPSDICEMAALLVVGTWTWPSLIWLWAAARVVRARRRRVLTGCMVTVVIGVVVVVVIVVVEMWRGMWGVGEMQICRYLVGRYCTPVVGRRGSRQQLNGNDWMGITQQKRVYRVCTSVWNTHGRERVGG